MGKETPKLKKIYLEKGITSCELQFEGCWGDNALGFAHRHKRVWYKGQEHKLSEFDQTLLACTNCHQKIEFDKKLTEEYFNKLRSNYES